MRRTLAAPVSACEAIAGQVMGRLAVLVAMAAGLLVLGTMALRRSMARAMG